MIDDKKVQDVLDSSSELGISGRKMVRASLVMGTMVLLAWYAFLIFLAVSVGLIPTIVMWIYVGLHLVGMLRSGAAVEEQIDRLEAAEAK